MALILFFASAASAATVEFNLDAQVARVTYEPGQSVEAWTYNGDIPGPLIHVKVGDRVVVHFTNHLPQPTTVHWHGLRIPIQMDGVPGGSQPEVQPGGAFTYDFIVPDAGLFWYHPHVMSATQVGYGLYGALLVDDPNDPIGIPDEHVLVLSDIAIDDHGVLQKPEGAGPLGIAFGLEGNHMLVNGRSHGKWTAPANTPQRWRIVNAAKSKYFQLVMDGPEGPEPFTLIGTDGGLREYATSEDTLVMAPGERMDVIVTPHGKPGGEILVRSAPYNRGYGSEYLPIEELFTITLSEPERHAPIPNFTMLRSITPLDRTLATAVNLDITLVQVNDQAIEYRVNNSPAAKMQMIHASVGETQIWTITNKTKWSHPIHIHGFFFQVLDAKGQPARPLAWKDTADVPFDQTVSFIVRFDDRPGVAPAMWMFHCHVLDHAEGGLMGMIHLTNNDSKTGVTNDSTNDF